MAQQTGPVVGWLPHDIYADMPCAGMELAAGISARLTLPATSAYLSPIYCANAAPVCYSDTAIGEELHGKSFAPLPQLKTDL